MEDEVETDEAENEDEVSEEEEQEDSGEAEEEAEEEQDEQQDEQEEQEEQQEMEELQEAFDTVVNDSKKKYGYVWGTGRRKTSVARVRLKEGNGTIQVNGKDYKQYFSNLKDQVVIEEPLKDVDQFGELDLYINANGGGKAGQAEAALLGIARALVKANPNLEDVLRDKGHLTRDPRMKERRKYGKHGARRGKQYSKR